MGKKPHQIPDPDFGDPEEITKAMRLLDLLDQPAEDTAKRPSVDADVSGRSAPTGGPFLSRPVKDLGLLLDDGFVSSLLMTDRTNPQLPVETPPGKRTAPPLAPELPSFLVEPPLARRRRRGGSPVSSFGSGDLDPLGSGPIVSAAAREALLQEPPREAHVSDGTAQRPGHQDLGSEFWAGLSGPSLKGWASEETVAVFAAPPGASSELPGNESFLAEDRAALLRDEAPPLNPRHGASPPPLVEPPAAERRAAEDHEDRWGSWAPYDEQSTGDGGSVWRSRALLRGLASLALPGWGQSLNGQPGKARFFRIGAFITLLFVDLLLFRHVLAGWVGALAPLGAAQAPAWMVGGLLTGLVSWLVSVYDAVVVTTNRR